MTGTGLHFFGLLSFIVRFDDQPVYDRMSKTHEGEGKEISYVHVVRTDLPVSVQSPAPACSEAN